MVKRTLFPDGTVITFGRKLSKAEKKKIKKQRQIAARLPVTHQPVVAVQHDHPMA